MWLHASELSPVDVNVEVNGETRQQKAAGTAARWRLRMRGRAGLTGVAVTCGCLIHATESIQLGINSRNNA